MKIVYKVVDMDEVYVVVDVNYRYMDCGWLGIFIVFLE